MRKDVTQSELHLQVQGAAQSVKHKVQQKDRSGPKKALYLQSQYLLQLPRRPLLEQAHTQ